MKWKRFLALSGLLAVLTAASPSLLAADPPAPQQPSTGEGEKPPAEPAKPPAEPAKPPEEATKPGFWGNRFALYAEVDGGGARTGRDIDSSITTSSVVRAISGLELDRVDHGRVTVGWQLPAERGHLLLTFNGYAEKGYVFKSRGQEAFAAATVNPDGSLTITSTPAPIDWYTLRSDDGTLHTALSIPFLNEEGQPLYDPENPNLNAAYDTPMAKNLQNRAQTWDALYQREFGGRMWRGRWSAGGRVFLYNGYVPMAAWLNDGDLPGFGFTEGRYLRLVPLKQEARGAGPTGSLEAQLHLFRNRVSLFAQGRVALLHESLSVDTGDFFTLVSIADRPPGDVVYAAPARLEASRKKAVWQVAAELGARVRIAEGLWAEAAFSESSFQDSVLVPTDLLIPKLFQEAPLGTSALYNTRDLLFRSWHAGLGFQF